MPALILEKLSTILLVRHENLLLLLLVILTLSFQLLFEVPVDIATCWRQTILAGLHVILVQDVLELLFPRFLTLYGVIITALFAIDSEPNLLPDLTSILSILHLLFRLLPLNFFLLQRILADSAKPLLLFSSCLIITCISLNYLAQNRNIFPIGLRPAPRIMAPHIGFLVRKGLKLGRNDMGRLWGLLVRRGILGGEDYLFHHVNY